MLFEIKPRISKPQTAHEPDRTPYDLYKDLFGEQLDTNQLHSVSDLLVQQQAEFD